MFTWPNNWGYRAGALVLWGMFLASLVGMAWGRTGGWPEPVLQVLAGIPGLTVAVQFYLAYRLIAREDEFTRALTAKRMLIAAGATITLATGWSAAEQFAMVPHIPLWLMYPLFWGVFGIVTPMTRGSQP